MEIQNEKEKIRYKVFNMRLNDLTIQLLKTRQKQSGKSWNLFIYELLKNDMGLLDDILNAPQKTERDLFTLGKDKPSIELNCEKCGLKFMGYSWMTKTKKEIICPNCWRTEKRNEEFN